MDVPVADAVGVSADGVGVGRSTGLKSGEAFRGVGFKIRCVFRAVNEDFVRVVGREVDIRFFLKSGIKPAVVDAEGDCERERDA